jgi:hypothetical protein
MLNTWNKEVNDAVVVVVVVVVVPEHRRICMKLIYVLRIFFCFFYIMQPIDWNEHCLKATVNEACCVKK